MGLPSVDYVRSSRHPAPNRCLGSVLAVLGVGGCWLESFAPRHWSGLRGQRVLAAAGAYVCHRGSVMRWRQSPGTIGERGYGPGGEFSRLSDCTHPSGALAAGSL